MSHQDLCETLIAAVNEPETMERLYRENAPRLSDRAEVGRVRREEQEPAACLLDTATGRWFQMPLRSESGEATDYDLGWAEAPCGAQSHPLALSRRRSRRRRVGRDHFVHDDSYLEMMVASMTNVSFTDDLASLSTRIAHAFATAMAELGGSDR